MELEITVKDEKSGMSAIKWVILEDVESFDDLIHSMIIRIQKAQCMTNPIGSTHSLVNYKVKG